MVVTLGVIADMLWGRILTGASSNLRIMIAKKILN